MTTEEFLATREYIRRIKRNSSRNPVPITEPIPNLNNPELLIRCWLNVVSTGQPLLPRAGGIYDPYRFFPDEFTSEKGDTGIYEMTFSGPAVNAAGFNQASNFQLKCETARIADESLTRIMNLAVWDEDEGAGTHFIKVTFNCWDILEEVPELVDLAVGDGFWMELSVYNTAT